MPTTLNGGSNKHKASSKSADEVKPEAVLSTAYSFGIISLKLKLKLVTHYIITGNDIIGDIININMKAALITIAVPKFGKFGPSFERFCLNIPTRQLDIDDDFKYTKAKAFAKAADCRQTCTLDVFHKANDIWHHSNQDGYYGFSYKSKDPNMHSEKQLGNIFLKTVLLGLLW